MPLNLRVLSFHKNHTAKKEKFKSTRAKFRNEVFSFSKVKKNLGKKFLLPRAKFWRCRKRISAIFNETISDFETKLEAAHVENANFARDLWTFGVEQRRLTVWQNIK